jgi:hypothetical protein
VERTDLWSVRTIEDLAAVTPCIDQADVAQDPEVFGDGRLREAQRDNDIADGMFPGREKLQDVSTSRFGDGVEGVRCRRGPGHTS